ncbi:MAG: helix-turn-helix domain-containing protein, partial [Candidatus Aminicenantaceae bacterium]
KFQVIMEVIKSSKPIGQIARAYGVHPITIHKWKKDFMEKGPECNISYPLGQNSNYPKRHLNAS